MTLVKGHEVVTLAAKGQFEKEIVARIYKIGSPAEEDVVFAPDGAYLIQDCFNGRRRNAESRSFTQEHRFILKEQGRGEIQFPKAMSQAAQNLVGSTLARPNRSHQDIRIENNSNQLANSSRGLVIVSSFLLWLGNGSEGTSAFSVPAE